MIIKCTCMIFVVKMTKLRLIHRFREVGQTTTKQDEISQYQRATTTNRISTSMSSLYLADLCFCNFERSVIYQLLRNCIQDCELRILKRA
jgi:phage regulator Rha-like protein